MLSVTDPISPAFERTRWMLFRPFDLSKWLGLGFCAFLANLGSGGGGNITFPNPVGGPPPDLNDWIRDNVWVVVLAFIAVMLVILAISLLVMWLSCRGKFMFLDGLVHNRGNVAAPWREFVREANSLLKFQIGAGLFNIVQFTSLVAAAVLFAVPDMQNQEFTARSLAAIVGGIAGFLMLLLITATIWMILLDIIVPIMYLRRLPVLAAWEVFFTRVLPGNALLLFLYLLTKILIGWLIGIIALLAMCLTCCLAALPYISSVVLLPLFVFTHCYTLYFLEQFGPDWQFFPAPPPPPVQQTFERRLD